jgi:hypothetical protein
MEKCLIDRVPKTDYDGTRDLKAQYFTEKISKSTVNFARCNRCDGQAGQSVSRQYNGQPTFYQIPVSVGEFSQSGQRQYNGQPTFYQTPIGGSGFRSGPPAGRDRRQGGLMRRG